MTIDEAQTMLNARAKCIEKVCRGIYEDCNKENCDNCDLCYAQGTNGEQKELMLQCVEWLEELKCYKNDNDFSDYADRLHKTSFNSGYNKAIDDFVEKLIRYVDCGHLCSPTEVTWSDLSVVEMIKELAEQLKAGD